MTADRQELHELIDSLPDDQIDDLLAQARRLTARPVTVSWPPKFFGIGSSNDGRRGNSERVDEILAEGFGLTRR